MLRLAETMKKFNFKPRQINDNNNNIRSVVSIASENKLLNI